MTRRPSAYTRAQSVASFLTRVKIGHISECWLWTGCTYNCGYGSFKWRGKMRAASRVAWEIANGQDVPEGMDVCHSCDVRLCVNPWHLFVGTASDNMLDMHRKGRAPQTALTPQQVREIRVALKTPYWGVQRDLAAKYKVSRTVICDINSRESYRFVTDELEPFAA